MCTNNAIIIDHYQMTQFNINITLTKFNRIQDYYWYSQTYDRSKFLFSPYIVLASILAQSTNSTVVSQHTISNTFGHKIRSKNLCPTIVPFVQNNDLLNRGTLFLWNMYNQKAYRKKLTELPAFVQVHPINANFAYCQVPKIEKLNLLSFSEFTDAFDKYFWAILFAAGISITLFIGTSKWLTLFSVLLSSGVPHNLNKLKARSACILVIWMFCATILNTLYSGRVTSTLISPPLDDLLSNVEELEKSNFSLLFHDKNHLALTKLTYQLMPNVGLHRYVKVIKRMINYAVVVSGLEDSIVQLYHKTKKYAIVADWPLVIQGAELLNDWNKNSTNISNKKRCYIGKELIPLGNSYLAFLPPKSEVLSYRFQLLIEMGIHDRWHQEYVGMSHSQRVQSRVRVKSPTRILKDASDTISTLGIHGKTLKVFVLWSMLLAVCILVLLLEVLSKFLNK